MPVSPFVPFDQIGASDWNIVAGSGSTLFEKLGAMPVRLGDVADIFVGLQTSSDKTYVLKSSEDGTSQKGLRKVVDAGGKIWELEQPILKPFLSHVSVATWDAPVPQHWLVFPCSLAGRKADLYSPEELAEIFPRAWKYLKANETALRHREGDKWNHDRWYAFGRSQNLAEMEIPKLITQVISRTGQYACDETGLYFTGGGNGPYYGIRPKSPADGLVHILQLMLSSRVADWFLRRISSPFRGGYWSYGKRYIEQIPLPVLSAGQFSSFALQKVGTRARMLAEQMLDLHKRRKASNTQHDRNLLSRQIDATDRQIDRLVYELYDLTDEEIALVEGIAASI